MGDVRSARLVVRNERSCGHQVEALRRRCCIEVNDMQCVSLQSVNVPDADVLGQSFVNEFFHGFPGFLVWCILYIIYEYYGCQRQ